MNMWYNLRLFFHSFHYKISKTKTNEIDFYINFSKKLM